MKFNMKNFKDMEKYFTVKGFFNLSQRTQKLK